MKLESRETTIRYVAGLMNDLLPGYEHTRWPLELMRSVYDDAVSALAMFRPDTSSSVVTMELKPGAMQQAPDGCNTVSKVLGQIDADTGNVNSQIEKSDSTVSKWFPPICGGSDYEIQGYEVDDSVDGVFFVDPPVPKGEKITVAIACVGSCKPDASDCRYTTAIVEFMMYRLYGSEDDSATSQGQMNTHLRNFVTFLGLNYQMVQAALGKNNGTVSSPSGQPE